jgi:hypothetical protein
LIEEPLDTTRLQVKDLGHELPHPAPGDVHRVLRGDVFELQGGRSSLYQGVRRALKVWGDRFEGTWESGIPTGFASACS